MSFSIFDAIFSSFNSENGAPIIINPQEGCEVGSVMEHSPSILPIRVFRNANRFARL